MPYKLIKNSINTLNIKEIVQFNLVDIYSDDTLGTNESLTIKFILQSDDRTMDEEFINTIMDKIIAKLNSDLGLTLR